MNINTILLNHYKENGEVNMKKAAFTFGESKKSIMKDTKRLLLTKKLTLQKKDMLVGGFLVFEKYRIILN
jgi:hypothetical protein|tara:strand:+ start:220 stop:429 length:210 start_codon:yes stop_codon:yes gene_type:complete